MALTNSTDPSEIYCLNGAVFFSSNAQEIVAKIVIVAMNIFISLAGTVANGLVIMAYYRKPRLRTIQNMLFFVLATTDIGVTLVVQPAFLAAILRGFLGKRDCLVWNITIVSSWAFLGISLATIAILNLQSYVTLAYPYQNIITKDRIRKALVVVWAFIFVTNVLSTVLNQRYQTFSDWMCLFIVLSTIICVVSTWVWTYKLLRKHRRNIQVSQTPATQNFGTRKKVVRSTVTAIFVTISLFGCYCLALLLSFRKLTGAWRIDRSVVLTLDLLAWTLLYLNSLLNPCLVFWRSSDYREAARSILTRRDISL
jgi:hypothetical protein